MVLQTGPLPRYRLTIGRSCTCSTSDSSFRTPSTQSGPMSNGWNFGSIVTRTSSPPDAERDLPRVAEGKFRAPVVDPQVTGLIDPQTANCRKRASLGYVPAGGGPINVGPHCEIGGEEFHEMLSGQWRGARIPLNHDEVLSLRGEDLDFIAPPCRQIDPPIAVAMTVRRPGVSLNPFIIAGPIPGMEATSVYGTSTAQPHYASHAGEVAQGTRRLPRRSKAEELRMSSMSLLGRGPGLPKADPSTLPRPLRGRGLRSNEPGVRFARARPSGRIDVSP